VAIIATVSQSSEAETPKYETITKLSREKSKDYLSNVAPTPIHLKIGMAYICASYDRRSGVVTSRVYQRLSWIDPRTAWNPSEHGGLEVTRVPIDKLWTPDIKLFNAFDEEEDIEDTNAVVLANGTIYWIPPITMKTYCERPDKDGKIHCELSMGSWTFSKADIELELFNNGFDTDMYLHACPYVVSHGSAHIVDKFYPCCPGSYPRFDVAFDIEPRPTVEHHEEPEKETHSGRKHKRRLSQTFRKAFESDKCVWPRCN